MKTLRDFGSTTRRTGTVQPTSQCAFWCIAIRVPLQGTVLTRKTRCGGLFRVQFFCVAHCPSVLSDIGVEYSDGVQQHICLPLAT